jgi:hypothetical protein
MTATVVSAPARRPLVRLLALLGCGQFADAVTAMSVLGPLIGDEHGVDGDRLLTSIAIAALPHALATPLSAEIVDRFDRVRTMTVVQFVRAAATVVVFTAIRYDVLVMAWAAAAVLLCSTRVVHTLRGAVLPNVAPPRALVPVGTATLLTGLAFGGLGAAIGVAVRGDATAPWIAAAAHVVAAVGFGGWVFDLGGRAAPPSRRAFGRSVTTLLDHIPMFRRQVGLIVIHRFLLGASFATLVAWIARASGAADGYLTVAGVTGTATVVGIASAPVAVSVLGHRGVEVGATAGSAMMMFAAARLDRAGFGLALAAVAFCLFQYQRSATESALQGGVIDAVRGRVLAAYDVIYNLAYLGGAATAVVAGFAGSSDHTLLALGVGYTLSAAALVWTRRPVMHPTCDGAW